MPLTDSTCRNAKYAPDGKNKLTDGDGLYLLLHKNGGKYWRQDYRFTGKRKTLAHGVANYGARHDRMNITTADFMNLPVPCPHPDEQRKIAECLAAIDQKIDAVADELAAVEHYKRGLLQQMFV